MIEWTINPKNTNKYAATVIFMEHMEELKPGYYFSDLSMSSEPFDKIFSGVGKVWEALDKKNEFLESMQAKILGKVEDGVKIEGKIFIGEGSLIGSGSVIKGPAYIGRNCNVRYGALIRDGAVIGDNCVIGHGAEIKNSIVLNGAKIQSQSFVGDSIIGAAGRIASGVITGNRRFDQKIIDVNVNGKKISTNMDKFGCVIGDHSRLGVNVTTAPGTLVGPHSWIYPNIFLRGFVKENSLVKLKQNLEICEKEKIILKSLDKDGRK